MKATLSRRALLAGGLGWGCLRAKGATSDEVSVVANASIPVDFISAEDLRAVFLGVKTTVHNARVRPVLSASSPVHQRFLSDVIGKSDAGLRIYYRSLVFTGRGQAPKELETEAKALEYVRQTAGAITCVSPGAAAIAGGERLKTVRVR